MNDPCEIAWAAGLFEGEGSIWFDQDGYPSAQINMCDREPLERYALIIGAKIRGPYQKKKRPDHSPYYTCCLRGEAVLPVMDMMFSLYQDGVKNRQADREASCSRGHAWTPENTYVRPGASGGKSCRVCDRLRPSGWERQRVRARRRAVEQRVAVLLGGSQASSAHNGPPKP